jgi:O-antigen ligase/Tfp pilus assembly protein PilF
VSAAAEPAVEGRTTALVFPPIAAGIVYLTFFAGAYGGVYLAQIRASSVAIASVVLLAWLVLAWRRPSLRPRSRLTPMLGIAVGTLALGTLTSRNPRISLDFVGYAVLLAGCYLLLVQILRSPMLRPRMGVLMVGLAVAVCGWYLLAVGTDWIAWWQMIGRLAVPPLRPVYEGLTFGNPGLVAAMAVLTALAAAGHLWGAGRVGQTMGVVLAFVALVVVVVTGTRGAWLAVAATGGAAAVLVVLGAAGRRAGRAALATARGRVALAAAVVVVLLAAVVAGPAVVDRVLNSGDGGRTSYWAAAVRMFEAAPLTGMGPGMWAPERIAYTMPPDIDYYIPHAHNLYLQTLSELGLLGIAASVAAVAIAGRLLQDGFRSADPARRRWAVVAVLGVVYFATHQLFDVYVGMPAALFAFAVPFAWLDATADATAPAGARPGLRTARRLAPAALAVAVVLAVGWTGWNEGPALTFDEATTAADRGDWATAATLAGAAASADPSMAPYRIAAGLAAGHLGTPGAGDLAAAAGLDGLPNAWLNLAAVRRSAGDDAGARTALDAAMRLGDQQPALLLAAGYLEERMGDTDAADRTYVAALGGLTRLAGATFWRDPARVDRWAAIAEAAVGQLDAVSQVDFWISSGDLSRAASAASSVPDAASRTVAQLGVTAWAGDASAFATLRTMAVAQPRNTAIVGWCARLAAHAGDASAAATYRYWLEIISPYSSSLGLEVRVTDELTPGGSPAGAIWQTYGIYTYRRPTPADLLLPGLPHAEWYVGLPAAAGG